MSRNSADWAGFNLIVCIKQPNKWADGGAAMEKREQLQVEAFYISRCYQFSSLQQSERQMCVSTIKLLFDGYEQSVKLGRHWARRLAFNTLNAMGTWPKATFPTGINSWFESVGIGWLVSDWRHLLIKQHLVLIALSEINPDCVCVCVSEKWFRK